MALNEPLPAEMRETARRVSLEALAQTNVEATFARQTQYENGTLRICEDLYPLRAFSRVLAVAIGKAGHSMAAALAKKLGPQVAGFVASPVAPAERLAPFVYFQGGLPSVTAPAALLLPSIP